MSAVQPHDYGGWGADGGGGGRGASEVSVMNGSVGVDGDTHVFLTVGSGISAFERSINPPRAGAGSIPARCHQEAWMTFAGFQDGL